MPDSNMFIVRKPQLVLENDQLFEKAKVASSKLPCPVRPGGHIPQAIKLEDATTQLYPSLAWGWSHSMFKLHGGITSYAYFCEACHLQYYIELAEKSDGSGNKEGE